MTVARRLFSVSDAGMNHIKTDVAEDTGGKPLKHQLLKSMASQTQNSQTAENTYTWSC